MLLIIFQEILLLHLPLLILLSKLFNILFLDGLEDLPVVFVGTLEGLLVKLLPNCPSLVILLSLFIIH